MAEDGKIAFLVDLDTSRASENVRKFSEQIDALVSNAMKRGHALDDMFKELGVSTEAPLRERLEALRAAAQESADVANAAKAEIEKQRELAEASLASGNMANWEDAVKDMAIAEKAAMEATTKLNMYKQAIVALSEAAGEAAEGASVANLLYVDEADYRRTKELMEQIEAMGSLRAQAADSDELSGTDRTKKLIEYDEKIIKLQEELTTLQTKARDAATELGDKVGAKAAEASMRLYELNEAVEEQQRVYDELSATLDEVRAKKEELEAIENRSDSENEELSRVLAQYKDLSEQLNNAGNSLANLKGQQTDAKDVWKDMGSAIGNVVGALGRIDPSIGKLFTSFRSLSAAIGAGRGAIASFRKVLAVSRGALNLTTISVKALGTAFKSLARSFGPLLAVSAVVAIVQKITAKIQEEKEKVEEEKKVIEEFNKKVAESAASPIASIMKLQKQWNALGDDLKAKKKFIADNKGEFNSLKLSIDNVSDAEKFFSSQTAAFVEAMKKRALATAYYGKAEEAYKKMIEAEQEMTNAGSTLRQPEVRSKDRREAADAFEDAKKRREAASKEAKALINASVKMENEAAETLTKAGIKQLGESTAKAVTSQQEKMAEAYTNALEKYRAEVVQSAKKAEWDIRQAEIDAMADGAEKIIAQSALNLEKQKDAIEEQQKRYIKDVTDLVEAEWKKNNPKGDVKFDRSSVRFDDETGSFVLPKGTSDEVKQEADKMAKVLSSLSAYMVQIENAANEEVAKKIAERNASILSGYRTFEERRLALAEDYAKKRAAVQSAGGTQGNIDELNRQELDALNALMAEEDALYGQWLDRLDNMTIEKLKEMLAEAKRTLAALWESGAMSPEEMNKALARIKAIEDALKKAKLSPERKDITSWELWSKTLAEAANEIQNIGSAMDGVGGEVVSSLGTIIGTTIETITRIQEIHKTVVEAIKTSSSAAVSSIKAVETASVVLTVISTAISLMRKLADLSNGISQRKAEEETRAWQKAVDDLTNAYDKLGKAVDAAMGTNKVRGLEEQILNQMKLVEQYRRRIERLKQKLDDLEGKKKSDWLGLTWSQDEIDKIKDEISGLEGNIYDITNNVIPGLAEEITNAIFGTSVQEAVEGLTDAMTSAWEDGKSSVKSVRDYVLDMMKDMIRQQILAMVQNSDAVKSLMEQMSRYILSVQLHGLGAAVTLAGEAGQVISDTFGLTSTMLSGMLDDMANDIDNSPLGRLYRGLVEQQENERTASRKGIANASQESVDELNGRASAIQGHTFNISANSTIIRGNVEAILGSVRQIERNTEAIRSDLYIIKKDGVKILS